MSNTALNALCSPVWCSSAAPGRLPSHSVLAGLGTNYMHDRARRVGLTSQPRGVKVENKDLEIYF